MQAAFCKNHAVLNSYEEIKVEAAVSYVIVTEGIRLKKKVFNFRKLIVPLQRNIERREKRREEKALIAARIEKGVEKALLERLRKGVVSI